MQRRILVGITVIIILSFYGLYLFLQPAYLLTSNQLSIFAPITGKLMTTIPIQVTNQTITSDGRYAYSLTGYNYAGGGFNISVTDQTTNSTSLMTVHQDLLRDIKITPNGKTVYVVSWSSGDVYAINTSTEKVISVIQVGPYSDAMGLSSDGSLLYVINGCIVQHAIHSCANSISIINVNNNAVISTVYANTSEFSWGV